MAGVVRSERDGRHRLPGTPHRHKGSRKRLGRIRWKRNWSPEIIVFLVAMLLMLTVVIPYLIEHPLPP
jgi:hypothetical protein